MSGTGATMMGFALAVASDGQLEAANDTRHGASRADGVNLPDRFIRAVSLADLDDVLDDNVMDKLRRRYEEYSRVVLAMGCFFFCTGLQWSLFIGEDNSYDERRRLCHHNVHCNLASPEDIGWMGLNPDMTWSNAVYFVTALLIFAVSKYHTSKGFRSLLGEGDTKVNHAVKTDHTFSRARAAKRKLLRYASMVGQTIIGRSETTSGKGFRNSHLDGMYWFAGTAIFVEGALSALYHTCPSKNFQQFDYIGITTCEIAIFLMMWSKCHPVLPTAGTMALYLSMLGLLSAAETPLPLKKKPIVWTMFGLWMIVVTPFLAVTLNYGLETIAKPYELLLVAKDLYHRGITFHRRALFHLVPIVLLFYLFMAVNMDSLGWWHTCIVLLIYAACMVAFGVFILLVRMRQHDSVLERFDDLSPVHGRGLPAKMCNRQRYWQVVRIAVFFLWIGCGVDHVVQGASFPQRHSMSHAIMQWHGKGAALYYVQFYVGLFFFKVIKWKTRKFLRAVVLLVLMLLCCLLGGDYFVNGTYKANAEIKRFGIPCETDGEADNSLCTQSANPFLDGDYSCGWRNGNYTCLIGSLDYNDGCSFIPGMDGHALWHFFSAIGLLLLPMSFLVVDDLLADVERNRIPVL